MGSISEGIDILFVHTGRILPDGQQKVPLVAIGLFRLAKYLEHNGFTARIYNLASSAQGTGYKELSAIIERRRVGVIGISLQWYHQCSSALEFARQIREDYPDIKIIMGGVTASVFAEEIERKYPFIDKVIRGNAEIELISYLGEAGVAVGAKKIVASKYTQIDMLLNGKKELLVDAGLRLIESPIPTFIYNPAQGCKGKCLYCGGGSNFHRKMSGTAWECQDTVQDASSILTSAISGGAQAFYLIVYPELESFYTKLFRILRGLLGKTKVYLECFYLPSHQFMTAMNNALGEGLSFILSPDVASEKLRRKTRTYYYNNESLHGLLGISTKQKNGVVLYFTTGIPNETREDFKDTLKWMMSLSKKYFVRFSGGAIPIEPFSPIFINPDQYGVKLRVRSFSDFIDASRGAERIGYGTSHFREDEIERNSKILGKFTERLSRF